MNYANLKKADLLNLVIEQQHLAKAVEVKDQEINQLNDRIKELIETHADNLKKHTEELRNLVNQQTKQLAAKEQEIAGTRDQLVSDLNKKHADERKALTDSVVNWEKKYYELDALRVKQLNTVLFAYGDLLKTEQGVVDTHLKLNQYIVDELSGGNK